MVALYLLEFQMNREAQQNAIRKKTRRLAFFHFLFLFFSVAILQRNVYLSINVA